MADQSVLGDAAVRGDADAVEGVAQRLRTTAEQLDEAVSVLDAHRRPERWEGPAADAFEGLVGDVPTRLRAARDACREAATAVTGYSGGLRDAQATAWRLAQQVAEAEAERDAATRRVSGAQLDLETRRRARRRAATPEDARAAQVLVDVGIRALHAAERDQDELDEELRGLLRQAATNREQLDGLAARTADALRRSGHLPGSPTIWSDVVAGGRTALHAAEWTVESAVSVVSDTIMLIPAIVRLVDHPDLEHLSEVLDDLSSALTLAVVALSIVATVVTGGAYLAALPAVLAALRAATVAVGAAKLGVDAARMRRGDSSVSYVDLGFDAFGLVGAGKDARAFAERSSGWMHGRRSQPKAWDAWAGRVVVQAEGRSTSWAELTKTAPQARRRLLREAVEDEFVDRTEDLTRNWLDAELPVVGSAPDGRRLSRLIHTGASRINHLVVLPVVVPARQRAVAGGGTW